MDEFPGLFVDGEYGFPILVYLGAKTSHWWGIGISAWCGDDKIEAHPGFWVNVPEGCQTKITKKSGQVGGKVRVAEPTWIRFGKNIGKANETNVFTQAVRDANGLFAKQLRTRSGARLLEPIALDSEDPEIPEAGQDQETGDDAFPAPMLARSINQDGLSTLKPDDFPVVVQRKYDGVLCVAFKDPSSRIVLYSRGRKEYPCQKTLCEELGFILADPPAVEQGRHGTERDDGMDSYANLIPYVVGELFCHGKDLNWISGQARNAKNLDLLGLYAFDVFFPKAIAMGVQMPAGWRQDYLTRLIETGLNRDQPLTRIHRVENFYAATMDEIMALRDQFLREGFEGAIVRRLSAGYVYSDGNYHSAALLKIKPLQDEEFNVVGFTEGTRGKDKGAVIWVCEVAASGQDGLPQDTFTVVPTMPYELRRALFKCLCERDGLFEHYLKNKPMTVQFQEKSKTGKPLQPKAKGFRDYGAVSFQEMCQICGIK